MWGDAGAGPGRAGAAAVAAHVAQRRGDAGPREIGLQGFGVLPDPRSDVRRGRRGVCPREFLDLGVDLARAVHGPIGKPLPERGREPPLVHRVGPGEEQRYRQRFGIERRDRIEHARRFHRVERRHHLPEGVDPLDDLDYP